MIRKSLFAVIAFAFAFNHAAYGADSARTNTMKIRMTVNGKPVTASLADNATSRDFVSLLPLSLTLEDYAATEKISTLPRKLDIAGAPSGSTPAAGDIAYYAPWGNLAIFHKDFRHSAGLVLLGRVDSGMGALGAAGPLRVTIERAD